MNDALQRGSRRGNLAHLAGLLALVLLGFCAQAAEGDELFAGAGVPRLQIEIPAAGMRVLRSYHQENGGPRPERVDVRATVREGDHIYTNVAIHLKGSWSFQPVDRKPSLTLNFDKFAPGQKFHGLDKIHLNNSAQDASYFHEALARELFNEAGVPTPRAGHAAVNLNGRELGPYVLLEGANKRFLKRHYDATDGNLYDGGSGGDLNSSRMDVDSGKNRDNRDDLKALIAATQIRDSAQRFARLDQVLDVDRFVTFAALEVLLVHWDGYCSAANNYHVFHDTGPDKLIFMPRGMDQILGKQGSLSASITPAWKGSVARALFSTGEGRRRYLERLNHVFTNQFQVEALNAKIDRLADRLRPVAAPGLLDGVSFQLQVRSLKSRVAQRISHVEGQLARPAVPVPFPASGVLSLTEWKFRPGPQGKSSGRLAGETGHELLEIRTAGTGATGSWRKTVALPPGQYELTGRGRVIGLPTGTAGTGLLLRISGERSVESFLTATNWGEVRYSFSVETPGSVELIGEYQGPQGLGVLDQTSLRLRRR